MLSQDTGFGFADGMIAGGLNESRIPADGAFSVQSSAGRRKAVLPLLTTLVMIGLAGCSSHHPLETGYANQGKTQIQFYAPPGTTVTVKACSPRSHQIAEYGPYENRLEQSPEEFSVFNLAPGRYEFKYITVEGLPGVSVYGELNVEHANSKMAKIFQRRSFVPLALPSEYYQRVEVAGNEIFPYRGEAFRTAIDEYDIQRLKEGDVIEKVILVADLTKAEKILKQTDQDIAVCEREIEYAEARFRLAHYDFRMDVADPVSNFFGTDRSFIRWEKKRRKLDQRLEQLEAKRQRTKALLKGDHVLVRQGMLVVATEEVVEPHRDVEDAADDLGEVLLVMRIGGRHMHWGDPRRELAAYEP